jgi:hypothetical protein
MGSRPDFWMIECDTFWLHVPPAVACTIIAGPAEMLSGGEQWLVRTDPPVFESDGTMTIGSSLIAIRPTWSKVTTGQSSAPGPIP